MRVRSPAGFTLVEVLIALVIVALAAAAALEAVSGAVDENVYLRDRSFAQWIALNRIVEQRIDATRPANGETRGVVEFAGRRWDFRQSIQPSELGVAGLRQIDVSVRLQSDGGSRIGANQDESWLVTVSGALGANVALPRGDEPDWEPAAAAPGPNNPGTPGANGAPPAGPRAPPAGT